MATHTRAPGRREETHGNGLLVFAAVIFTIDALVVRGNCVAPRPMRD
jgi:hypothetical protein